MAAKTLPTKNKVAPRMVGKDASSKMKSAMAKRTAANAAAQTKAKAAVKPDKAKSPKAGPAPKPSAVKSAQPIRPASKPAAAKPQAAAAPALHAEHNPRTGKPAIVHLHPATVGKAHGLAANPPNGNGDAKPAAGLPPRPVLAASHTHAGTPVLAPKRPLSAPHAQQLPRDVIDTTAAAKLEASKKKTSQRHGFKIGEYVVYPSHGVGKIIAIEEQVVAGHALELFVINFEHEKMTLRVPTAKLVAVGMRKLAEDGIVRRAMETLKGRARVKRTMWSRRAQEYENKINSGDLVSISEVVRDLYRAETQPEQSYSERQLFEAALDRMSREIAAIEKLDERGAVQKITDVLSKSARGRAATKAAEEAAAAGTDSEGQAA